MSFRLIRPHFLYVISYVKWHWSFFSSLIMASLDLNNSNTFMLYSVSKNGRASLDITFWINTIVPPGLVCQILWSSCQLLNGTRNVLKYNRLIRIVCENCASVQFHFIYKFFMLTGQTRIASLNVRWIRNKWYSNKELLNVNDHSLSYILLFFNVVDSFYFLFICTELFKVNKRLC